MAPLSAHAKARSSLQVAKNSPARGSSGNQAQGGASLTHLRLRGVFLEVSSAEATSPRASSEPGNDFGGRKDFFVLECESIKQLSKMLEAQWQQRSEADSDMGSTCVDSPSSRRWADLSDDEIPAAPAPAPPVRGGSFGHPDLCSRPCLNYIQGNCDRGDACHFCHRPHSKRPSHLDKRHRDLLKTMSREQLCSLALPIICEKITNFGIPQSDMQGFIDGLNIEVNDQQLLNRAMRGLRSSLAALPLKASLQILQQAQDGEGTQERLKMLKAMCRRSARDDAN